MRCVFADTDPTFLAELKRCFNYTPVSPNEYPLVVRGQASTAWNAVPPTSVAWLVAPGEHEFRLRLEVEGSGRAKLHCPAAVGWNARQLVRAVLKHVGAHGGHVDFLVMPRMGDGSAAVARSMHAGYVEGVTKKSDSLE